MTPRTSQASPGDYRHRLRKLRRVSLTLFSFGIFVLLGSVALAGISQPAFTIWITRILGTGFVIVATIVLSRSWLLRDTDDNS